MDLACTTIAKGSSPSMSLANFQLQPRIFPPLPARAPSSHPFSYILEVRSDCAVLVDQLNTLINRSMAGKLVAGRCFAGSASLTKLCIRGTESNATHITRYSAMLEHASEQSSPSDPRPRGHGMIRVGDARQNLDLSTAQRLFKLYSLLSRASDLI